MDDNSPNEQQPTETTDDNINPTITNDHNNNIDTTNTNTNNPDNTLDNNPLDNNNQSLEDEDDDPYTDVSSISEEGGTEKLQRNFSNLSGKEFDFVVLFICVFFRLYILMD